MNKILFVIFLSILLNSCIPIPHFRDEWVFPEIKGYVFDSISNLPLRNVNVFEKYYSDTIQTDSSGFFNFKAKKEYFRFRFIAMDGPKPFMEMRFEKAGYVPKEIIIKYTKIEFSRENPDTFDLKRLKLINSVP
jgi:hypothetical protein